MSRKIKRIATAATILALAATAATTTNAGAALSLYRATGGAEALDVSVVDQQATLGQATSLIESVPKAVAKGAGNLVAVEGVSAAERTSTGADSPGEVCSPLTLPPEVPVVDLATGCGSAFAEIVGGLPRSNATGKIAGLGVGVVDLPVPLEDILGSVPLPDVCDLLGDGAACEALGIDVDSTLQELLSALTQGGDALSIAVGPATTHTFADAATVTSEAGTAKTVINILNRDLLQLPPVMTIEVLPSAAKVVRNKADGAIISQGGTPAALRINVAPDIVSLTGLPASIEVGNNEQLAALRDSGLFDANGCLNPGAAIPAPLDALVCVKLATVEKFTRGGTVGVEATTLQLRVLDSLLQAGGLEGGAGLRFGHALAQVEAVAAVPPAVPNTPRDLPRTGGSSPIPLGLAAGLATIAAIGLVAARRARATAH